MRYSGMRISDAVTLTTDRIDGKRLFLYTQKTAVPVYTVLPDAEDARRSLHGPRITLYFWSGQSRTESVAGLWEKRPKKLFGLAGITKGQGNAVSHRLRETFGVAVCSDIRACGSPRSITTPGYAPAKRSLRLMSRGLGNSIRF